MMEEAELFPSRDSKFLGPGDRLRMDSFLSDYVDRKLHKCD